MTSVRRNPPQPVPSRIAGTLKVRKPATDPAESDNSAAPSQARAAGDKPARGRAAPARNQRRAEGRGEDKRGEANPGRGRDFSDADAGRRGPRGGDRAAGDERPRAPRRDAEGDFRTPRRTAGMDERRGGDERKGREGGGHGRPRSEGFRSDGPRRDSAPSEGRGRFGSGARGERQQTNEERPRFGRPRDADAPAGKRPWQDRSGEREQGSRERSFSRGDDASPRQRDSAWGERPRPARDDNRSAEGAPRGRRESGDRNERERFARDDKRSGPPQGEGRGRFDQEESRRRPADEQNRNRGGWKERPGRSAEEGRGRFGGDERSSRSARPEGRSASGASSGRGREEDRSRFGGDERSSRPGRPEGRGASGEYAGHGRGDREEGRSRSGGDERASRPPRQDGRGAVGDQAGRNRGEREQRAGGSDRPAAVEERRPRARPEAEYERKADQPFAKRLQAAEPVAESAAAAKPPRPVVRREEGEAEGVRLSKVMAERGICSRREADELIARGWVFVDGRRVSELGTRIAADARVDLAPEAKMQQAQRVTILLHKPVGYVSGQPEPGYEPAVSLIGGDNQFDRDTAQRFHYSQLKGLAPAGRLDIDSTGLLVLTQDGRVARMLIGENSKIEKEYLVRVEGELLPDGLALLRHGLSLDDKPLRPAEVEWINDDQLRFVLREGRKRQIRRMCELVGLKVVGLKRVRIGRVRLGDLPLGQWRYLREDEGF